MDIVSEWDGQAFNLFAYIILHYLKHFDGHVALIHMFSLNKMAYTLLKQKHTYDYTTTYLSYCSVQPDKQQVLQPTALNSRLRLNDRVSILHQNNPAFKRHFELGELALFEKCPELKAWSNSNPMLHKVNAQKGHYLHLVPDLELTPDTQHALAESELPSYHSGNVFVRMNTIFRDKLWAVQTR